MQHKAGSLVRSVIGAASAVALGLPALSAIALPARPAKAATARVVYAFKPGGDGVIPFAGLVNMGGTLFGTTCYGGAHGQGAIFALNPATGAEQLKYSFKGGSDGACPYSNLVNVAGALYGMTRSGGAANKGTIFRMVASTGAERVVYSFTGGADSTGPGTALAYLGGLLYGTTSGGGSAGYGTIFSVNPSTGAETVVHSFLGSPNDGSEPAGGVIALGGLLYGTTQAGGGTYNGPAPNGTVFKFDPASRNETILYRFTGAANDTYPGPGLLAIGGALYGVVPGNQYCTTGQCYGAVFKLDPNTGSKTTVYAFKGGAAGDVAWPSFANASLTNIGSVIYGITRQGPWSTPYTIPLGGVYKLDIKSGTESVIYGFHGSPDGDTPTAALVNVGGTLYGTTSFGGQLACIAYACGTVFSITP